MKQCTNCKANMADDAMFCTACGTKFEQQQSAPAQPTTQNQPVYQAVQTDNRKLYCILSYIGILWLLGLLLKPEKDDPRVRFNVGQGIIASIVGAGLSIVGSILSFIVSLIFSDFFGFINPVGALLNTIIWLSVSGVSLFFMIFGIVKVAKDEDAYLPIIGNYSFYK